jgi:hypothetical protein
MDPAVRGNRSGIGRRPVIALIVASLVLVGVALFGLFVWRGDGSPAAGALREAADALAAAPAVRVEATTRAAGGRTIAGRFVVTGDGYASGTVSDRFAGTAELRAGAGRIAVRGDEAWWARRAPTHLGVLVDRWVHPEPDAAFPVDVAATLGAIPRRGSSTARTSSTSRTSGHTS